MAGHDLINSSPHRYSSIVLTVQRSQRQHRQRRQPTQANYTASRVGCVTCVLCVYCSIIFFSFPIAYDSQTTTQITLNSNEIATVCVRVFLCEVGAGRRTEEAYFLVEHSRYNCITMFRANIETHSKNDLYTFCCHSHLAGMPSGC